MIRRVPALAAVLLSAGAFLYGQRLPATVVPEHYALHFAPDLVSKTFTGEATISVRLAAETHAITLHAAEMQFTEAAISQGTARQTASVSFDAAHETATLSVAQPIPAGAATIFIRYAAPLNDQLRGFYVSHGNGRDYAVTQLEATDARRAFPSFDEPALKATFDISATIDTRDTAISNGRMLSDTPGPSAGKHTLTFARTPRMSTYVVALAVGDWECVRGGADGIPIRICARAGLQDHLDFALQSAEIAMRYYNRYLGVRYPFEKLDVVGVPDFSAGAMENTAAIVFREQSLLSDPDNRSVAKMKQVAQYISHEIAHQWFGDLVTPKWWNDVWLNEGFATWMEGRPPREWKPEWNIRFGEVQDTQGALSTDALEHTRPVRTAVETTDQINEVFDAIAYQKTAQIVRMVEGFVGPENYRTAVGVYLKKFSYANASGEDYWNTIAQVTKKPVDKILETFMTQPSLPIVGIDMQCNAGTTEVRLAQQPMSTAVPASTVWQVPVCYKRARNGSKGVDGPACEVLSSRSQTLRLPGCSSWIYANVEARGYYRTSYARETFTALAGAVRSRDLSIEEQASLLEDTWAMVRLNRQKISGFLALTQDIVQTGGISPVVESIAGRIVFLSDHLVGSNERSAFEAWVRTLFRPMLDRIGWNPAVNESDERKELRSTIVYTLGYAGRDPDVLHEARRRVDMFLASAGTIEPTLFNTLVRVAALNGDEALYNRYLERIRNGGGRTGRDGADAYRMALPFFSDPALRKRTLELATSSEVRTQDSPRLLASMMQRPVAAPDTWQHVKSNWEELQRTGVFQGMRAIIRSTNNFCDEESRNDVERFFAGSRISGNERLAQQSMETIGRCVALRREQTEDFAAFLKAPGPGPTPTGAPR